MKPITLFAICVCALPLVGKDIASPPHASAEEVLSGKLDDSPLVVDGTVIDAYTDEIDPDSTFVIINSGNRCLTVMTESDCRQLIGKRISVTGVCRKKGRGLRSLLGRHVFAAAADIRVVETCDTDPFSAPEIESIHVTEPEELAHVRNVRLKGRVVASWYASRFLVKSPTGQTTSICHSEPENPSIGDIIEVVGVPVTDLCRINLLRCHWRTATVEMPPDEPAVRISLGQLKTDEKGRKRFDIRYHGRKVTFTGKLIGHPSSEGANMRILIDSQDHQIALYMRPEIAQTLVSESVIEVTGTYVVDTAAWGTPGIIPKVSEALVSVASPQDIRLLSGPPWWTPGRLLVLIGGLLMLILGLMTVNHLLKRQIARKCAELEQEISTRLRSNLKTRERTRLAVELHDSIAQSLSGIAMEIGSAVRLSTVDPALMRTHLDLASKTLTSCRDDLKDCLWDLRSKALEIDDMNDAIRATLTPYVNDETLHIRFNVSRKRLSDNTAHALFRIIRELASNAIKHGHATALHIAGNIDGRRLLFSVRDNGCGFDPLSRPGVAQGHFGLQGISERVNRFNGKLTIESTPGKGTKVTISIDISSPEEEDESNT